MTPDRPSHWPVERSTAEASALLDPWPPVDGQGHPVVRISRVRGRALVLGSTQDASLVDERRAASAGVDIVRRSTGGGAVLVGPDAQVWFDVWLPRRHAPVGRRHHRRLGLAGETWVRALEGLGAGPLNVHRGPLVRTLWSDLVCFAGLGPGEVTVPPASGAVTAATTGPGGGPKVVGLAQRRTRAGARFHTTAPLSWDPAPLLGLLTDAAPDDVAGASLTNVAVGLRAVVAHGPGQGTDAGLLAAVENAVLRALP